MLQHQPLELRIPPPPASNKTHTKEENPKDQTRENVYLLHVLAGFIAYNITFWYFQF